jgi:[acyl-carrier-protein] S-malonyltransferase
MTETGERAALFPGQGIAVCRSEVENARPDLVAALDNLVGKDAFADTSTACAQPAIYCASLASWSTEKADSVQYFAGYSLGEITALVAAGWLDEFVGLQLVVRRGAAMERCCRSAPGGMLAVLGLEFEETAELADKYGLAIANDNAPGQVILAGEVESLEVIAIDLTRNGVACKRLPVAGAFHCSMMQDAVVDFEAALLEIRISAHSTVVVSGATAKPFADTRRELATALTKRVRWRELLLRLRDDGVDSFCVYDPSKSLAGMVKRTLGDAAVVDGSF